jgi:hypothetical protein
MQMHLEDQSHQIAIDEFNMIGWRCTTPFVSARRMLSSVGVLHKAHCAHRTWMSWMIAMPVIPEINAVRMQPNTQHTKQKQAGMM